MLKTAFDKTASAVGLLLLSPLLLAIALYVWASMGRPVIFCQRRVGRHGRLFTIYKFRTMADTDGKPAATPQGRWLRRYKLDELPELWNVLRGDMSLVGPRPDVEGYADQLTGEERGILSLRPGITGPATLKYRDEEVLLSAQEDPQWYNDNVVYPDKVRINMYYLRHPSLRDDLRIILCTVLGRRMEYGGETI